MLHHGKKRVARGFSYPRVSARRACYSNNLCVCILLNDADKELLSVDSADAISAVGGLPFFLRKALAVAFV